MEKFGEWLKGLDYKRLGEFIGMAIATATICTGLVGWIYGKGVENTAKKDEIDAVKTRMTNVELRQSRTEEVVKADHDLIRDTNTIVKDIRDFYGIPHRPRQ